MKTTAKVLSALFFATALIVSCQKELSFEKGPSSTSVGSLQTNASGGCLGAVVSGAYKKDTVLNASHYVNVNVQVDTIGTYTITSDTVNGYSFKATGTFTATGVQVVKLVGAGKPLAAGTNVFTVTYNGTTCDFPITVTAAGGGGGSAVFTVACTPATINGTYQAGTALTGANTVVLNVNVSTPGSWTITTSSVNGMVFNGSGNFAAAGAQTITLAGSGTPTAAGTFNIPVTVGGATCNFSLTVTAGGPPPIDYFPRTVNSNWSYEFDGDPNDSLLVKVVAGTITAAGSQFNIFMETDDASAGFDSSGYYRKSGNNYYEWLDLSIIGYDDPMWVEYNFLRDNVSAGGTWTTQSFTGNVSGTPITSRFKYTIISKDITVTVGTTAFPNTIVVKEELEVEISAGVWSPVAGFIIYNYARNVGLIKLDFDDGAGNVSEMDVRRQVVY